MVVEKGWVRPAAQVGVCVCTMARRGRGRGSGRKKEKNREEKGKEDSHELSLKMNEKMGNPRVAA